MIIGLLNLNQPVLAQTTQATRTTTTKAIEAEITEKTINQLNAERSKSGKSQIDINNFDASIKDLSPSERSSLFTDLDRVNVEVRLSYGLAAARIPRFTQPNGVAGVSEIHEKFVQKVIKEKSEIGSKESKDKETESPRFGPHGLAGEGSKVKIAGVDDSNDMMGSITMLAIGFIVSRLYKYKMTTDIMIAATGGAAYIVGEILSTKKFKEVSDDLEVEVKNNKNNQTQIESLNKLKQSYQGAKEAAETKKKFQTAAAVAFIGAAAVAFFMKGLEITAEVATVSALTSAAAAASATAAAASLSCPVTGAGCILITPCTTAATTFAADVAVRKQMNLLRDTNVAPSMSCQAVDLAPRETFFAQVTTLASACPPAAAVPAVVKSEDVNQWAGNSFTPVPVTADLNSIFFQKQPRSFKFYTQTPPPQINQNYFEKIMHFLMPSANASMMNLLMGGAGAGAGVLIGMVGTMGGSVDTFMFAPKNRGIIWGVLAGLSFGASKSTESVISKIENNIQKIDNILSGMNSLSKGVVVGSNGRAVVPVSSSSATTQQKLNLNTTSTNVISANPADRTSCFGSNGDSNCSSLSNQLVSLPDFKMLPPQLQGMSSEAAKIGDWSAVVF